LPRTIRLPMPAVVATVTASIQLVVLVISATALKATKAILTFLVMADVKVCITNITDPYIIQSLWS